MAARSIVTSHPDVECDFCRRRLLRGERPNVFLAGGHRRTVCELCAPRAADVGWMREDDRHTQLVSRPARSLRPRGLLWRLRQRRDGGPDSDPQDLRAADPGAQEDLASYPFGGSRAVDPLVGGSEVQPGSQGAWEPLPAADLQDHPSEASYDFLGPLHPLEQDARARAGILLEPGSAVTDRLDEHAIRALAAFNAGHHPRRIAGIARSLGPPRVNVRLIGPVGVLVQITVAWEICWYRYEVDPSDPGTGARLAAEGMELQELPDEDLLENALADERGELGPL